jgi:hypothetical protein
MWDAIRLNGALQTALGQELVANVEYRHQSSKG